MTMLPLDRVEPMVSSSDDSPVSAREQHRALEGSSPLDRALDDPTLMAAYQEYCDFLEKNQSPDVEAFCSRHPECEAALRELLSIDHFFDKHTEHVADVLRRFRKIKWPERGEKRDDYTILRELGRGTFARVYLATEASTGDRLVAVKFSLDGHAEARTLGRLAHPHVIPILSARVEKEGDLTIVCMSYLGSTTLEYVLDRLARLPVSERPRDASFLLDLLRERASLEGVPVASPSSYLHRGDFTEGVLHLAVQLAEALTFLHEQGVSHCDLKPSNVLLESSGNPRLLDFNLSVSNQETLPPIAGSLRYLSPEQLRGFLNYDKSGRNKRADVFALGVMVYELLVGTHPAGALPKDLKRRRMAKHLRREYRRGVPSFARSCPDLEPPVAAVLDSCLAFDPSKRPSADALATALKRQFNPVRRLRRRFLARPYRHFSLLALAVVALSLTGILWATAPSPSARAYRAGMTAYQRDDFEEAEQHFNRACLAEPHNKRFRFARGCARLQIEKACPGDSATLDLILDDLIADQHEMTTPAEQATLAYVQIRKQNYRVAINLYDQLTLTDYRRVMLLNNRAVCCISVKRYEDANEDLRRAEELDPNCQAVHYNRAKLAIAMRLQKNSLLITGRDLESMENAIRLGPCTTKLYSDAALIYKLAAESDLRRTPISLDSPIVPALHTLARQAKMERALFFQTRVNPWGQPANFPHQIPDSSPHVRSQSVLEKPRIAAPFLELPKREIRLVDPVELVDE